MSAMYARTAQAGLTARQTCHALYLFGKIPTGCASAVASIPIRRFLGFYQRLGAERNLHDSAFFFCDGIQLGEDVLAWNPPRAARLHVCHASGDFFLPGFGDFLRRLHGLTF